MGEDTGRPDRGSEERRQRERKLPREGFLSSLNRKIIAGALALGVAGIGVMSLIPTSDSLSQADINSIVSTSNSVLALSVEDSSKHLFPNTDANEMESAFEEGLWSNILFEGGEASRVSLPTEEQKQQILDDLREGRIDVAAITLWDNNAEDGDVVVIGNMGVQYEIPIFHEPTTVFVPYVPGQSSVKVTGLVDGGGGVTVAAASNYGLFPIPPLAEGQSVDVPLQ